MPVAGEGDVDGYKALLSQIAPAVSDINPEAEARIRNLVAELYTLADVLIARAGSRSTAGGAVSAGRALEDRVEAVIEGLGLLYETRTQFGGRGGETAPCDFAIPRGGEDARIAIPVKGFDSTGSKLTAAYDEIHNVANVRLPGQYIFAVVDGVGWLGRTGDLSRLVEMVRRRDIDGMFALKEFKTFAAALRDAAIRSRLLDS